MSKQKQNQNPVASTISRLTVPYIEKYGDKITGVYLYPYQIGNTQKIDIVIITDIIEDISIIKNQVSINELKIFVSINKIDNYRGKIDTDIKIKLAKELKGAQIIYDPTKTLDNRKRFVDSKSDIKELYNGFELPKEIIKTTKSNIYSLKRK